MENKKKLEINATLCNACGLTEEYLSRFERVEINTATLLISPEAQAVLAKYEVTVNAASSISLEKGIRVSVFNAPLTIRAGQAAPEQRIAAVLNGPLTIESGSEEVLDRYVFLCVNGPVTCPESMVARLRIAQINGPIRTYPDGAILLKRNTVLDRVFLLRARQGAHYCAISQIVALAPDIDFTKLAEKNVRFSTRRLLVGESMAEAAVPLFNEEAEIEILPDGCAYVGEDAVLDSVLVRRYGGKLYIDGSLTINRDSAAALDQVSYLRVDGRLLLTKGMQDRVLAMDVVYDGLEIVGSILIKDRPRVEVSAAMLEEAEEGVSLMDCACVTFAEDIAPALLREKLVSLVDCACVECSREQLPVMESAARNVAHISCGGEEEEQEQGEKEADGDTVSINTAVYTIA